MENYKKKIKTKTFLCGVIILLATTLMICQTLFDFKLDSANEAVSGFQQGLIVAIDLLCLITFIKYSVAIKSKDKLQILYNKEHDERQIYIKQKAGMPMLMVTSGLLILVGVIAGYFNEVVFVTLIAAAVCQMTIGALVKIFYLKKMG